jgi:hypothetical protein
VELVAEAEAGEGLSSVEALAEQKSVEESEEETQRRTMRFRQPQTTVVHRRFSWHRDR